jgi:hypothetical protein
MATLQIEEGFSNVMTVLFLRIQDELIMGIYILCGCTGFLPEEWDGFLVTNLYPSFTPTVGVFLAAAVAYGLFKTQGGEPKK